jgi:glutaredoxin
MIRRVVLAIWALAAAALLAAAPADASCAERVVVFDMPGCVHCKNTKDFLAQNDIPFHSVDVWDHKWAREFMEGAFGSAAVPVTVNRGQYVRGFDVTGLRSILCLDE